MNSNYFVNYNDLDDSFLGILGLKSKDNSFRIIILKIVGSEYSIIESNPFNSFAEMKSVFNGNIEDTLSCLSVNKKFHFYQENVFIDCLIDDYNMIFFDLNDLKNFIIDKTNILPF